MARNVTQRASPGQMVRFLLHLPNFVKLYWRLFNDARVSVIPKALIVAAGIYLVVPFDFDFAVPGLGYIDDILVIWLALKGFIRLCPKHVVDEHVARIDRGEDAAPNSHPPPPV